MKFFLCALCAFSCCIVGQPLLMAEPPLSSENPGLVSEIFLKRHSGKAYYPSIGIPKEQLWSLMESARWTPSSFNDQPWNFIFCDKALNPEAYKNALESLVGNQKWAKKAPMLIVVIARTKFTYNNLANEWAFYDTGAAALAMSLQAADIGLMVHQIGGFDKQKIRQDFNLPADYEPVVVMTLGYEDMESSGEAAPRIRRPMDENFFMGSWGQWVESAS